MDHSTGDYGDEYGGAQKMRYRGGGAISALADDEVIGDDDEYDDLYNDVNVGGGFQQIQQPVVQMHSAGAGNEVFLAPKSNLPKPNIHLPESKEGLTAGATDSSESGRVMGINFNAQKENFGFQRSNPMPQKVDTSELPVKGSSSAQPVLNPGIGHNQMSMNVNQSNNEHTRPAIDNGATMLFVGELHWWTTDAELESVLS